LASKNSAAEVIGCAAVAIAASGVAGQHFGDVPHERGVDERLVALHVDDDVAIVEPELPHRFGEPVGARLVLRRREEHTAAEGRQRVRDGLGGRWPPLPAGGAALLRALHHPGHERLAAHVREHLPRQAGRAHARRDHHR
jgi:hypothetical protein